MIGLFLPRAAILAGLLTPLTTFTVDSSGAKVCKPLVEAFCVMRGGDFDQRRCRCSVPNNRSRSSAGAGAPGGPGGPGTPGTPGNAVGNPGNTKAVGRAGEAPNRRGGWNEPQGGPGEHGQSD